MDAIVEARVVLEKVRVLEGRMKYQIDKLVRIAEEGDSANKNIANGVFLHYSFSSCRYSFLARPPCVPPEPPSTHGPRLRG